VEGRKNQEENLSPAMKGASSFEKNLSPDGEMALSNEGKEKKKGIMERENPDFYQGS